MAIDLTALKNEIVNDPMGLGYAAMTNDKQISDKLNETGASGEQVSFPFPIPDYIQWLASTAILDALEIQKTAHADPAVRAICFAALALLQRQDIITIDVHDPANESMIDALVAGGVMTAAQKTDLFDTQTMKSGSRCEVLFGYDERTTPSIVAQAKAS